MAGQEYIAGIDIGSTAVRIAVGVRTPGSENKMINIIGLTEVPSEGVHRGIINSIDDVVSSISMCRERLERMIGAPVDRVWVGISGPQIVSQTSRGFIAVARADGEIQEEDMERAIEAARTVPTQSNYEIIHVLPKSFTVDRQAGVKSPVGMIGTRLEVDAEIIQAPMAQRKNLTNAIYRARLDIEDLVYAPLATSEAVASDRQKKLGTAMINIGSGTTSLIVFEEGDVLHTAVLPLGSEHITADIGIGLRTSPDIAEEIKTKFGTAAPAQVNKNEEINLRDVGASEDEFVSRRHVAEIIEARVEEIYEKVDKELRRIDRSGLLPGGAVLTGGGSKLPGMVDLAKRTLRLPASLGYPAGIMTVTEAVHDLSFSTAVGLVLWGDRVINTSPSGGSMGGGFGKIAKGLGKLFGSFRP
ncbi:cell division protein FtsA [Candidatus Uhrbacteria bacterium]|nr:cell division protein FtsA [Candidatus Uhrbacteria bacterium]